ncbi:MAG: DUF6398 domain-containing protein [Candidatus Binataceae bacterium]
MECVPGITSNAAEGVTLTPNGKRRKSAAVGTTGNDRPSPATLARSRAEEIVRLTQDFCAQHLDAEYAELCAKLIGRLARKRPSPLARGETRVWAGAVLYAIGQVNFLFDPTQHPHIKFDDLSRLIGVSKSALATRARDIRNLLRIMPLEPQYCRRELLAQNPLAWMIEVDGIIVDARTLPAEVQTQLRQRGLIPDLDCADA